MGKETLSEEKAKVKLSKFSEGKVIGMFLASVGRLTPVYEWQNASMIC